MISTGRALSGGESIGIAGEGAQFGGQAIASTEALHGLGTQFGFGCGELAGEGRIVERLGPADLDLQAVFDTAEQVTPGQHGGDRFGLDGGRGFIAVLAHGLHDGRGQVQVFKVHWQLGRPSRALGASATPPGKVPKGQNGQMDSRMGATWCAVNAPA